MGMRENLENPAGAMALSYTSPPSLAYNVYFNIYG